MATRVWLGAAVPIAQVDTVVLGGTWAQNDTVTLTINGKDLVLTVGATFDIPTILDNLLVMVTGSGTFGTGYSATQTGNNVGEFAALSYEEDGSTTLTITGQGADSEVPGQPFTLSGNKTSTSGTITVNNEDTSPNGPHHFDDADNWSGATVPVDADDVVFDHRARSDLLFALDQSTLTPASITITQGFTQAIGLPEINRDDSNPDLHYNEYRDTYLKWCDSTDATTTVITIGSGDGAGSGRLKMDLNTGQVTAVVLGSGTAETNGIPAVLLKGTHASNELNVLRGDVGIAFFDGESAHLATLRVGFVESIDGDASVVCGGGVDLTDAAITQTGGTLVIDSTTSSGTIDVTGGQLTALSGAHASIDVDGGELVYRSTGTVTTLLVGGGGVADFSLNVRGATVTNCELHAGGTLRDPHGFTTFTNGIDLVRTALNEVTLEIPPHRTVSLSAI